jgi:hypothetical protein
MNVIEESAASIFIVEELFSSVLKMKPADSSEMLVMITRLHGITP